MRWVTAGMSAIAAVLALMAPCGAREPVLVAPSEPPDEVVDASRYLPNLDAFAPEGKTFEVTPSTRAAFPRVGERGARLADTQPSYDLNFAARTPLPFEIGVTQRARLNEDDDSVVFRGREYRLGDLGVGEFTSRTWDNPQWYLFVANDDGALTYTPGARESGTNTVRVDEDRLTIGDFQAGLSVEAAGISAALSYIQRDVSSAGQTEDGSFTGFSVTYRR